jgi:SAM-dependent methyltransferase
MRAELAAAHPDIPVHAGSAAAIPLPDGAVDAITCGQAFHWFDLPRALPEMARVLAPGGGLALLWNERDDRVPWVAELSRILHAASPRPYDERADWAAQIASTGDFDPRSISVEHFTLVQPMTAALLEDSTVSRSYIAAMEPAERAPILAAVRDLVRDFPEPFALPFVTQLWLAIPLPDKRR